MSFNHSETAQALLSKPAPSNNSKVRKRKPSSRRRSNNRKLSQGHEPSDPADPSQSKPSDNVDNNINDSMQPYSSAASHTTTLHTPPKHRNQRQRGKSRNFDQSGNNQRRRTGSSQGKNNKKGGQLGPPNNHPRGPRPVKHSDSWFAGVRRAKKAAEKVANEVDAASPLDLGRDRLRSLMEEAGVDTGTLGLINREELLAEEDEDYYSTGSESEHDGSKREVGDYTGFVSPGDFIYRYPQVENDDEDAGESGTESMEEDIDMEVDAALESLGLDGDDEEEEFHGQGSEEGSDEGSNEWEEEGRSGSERNWSEDHEEGSGGSFGSGTHSSSDSNSSAPRHVVSEDPLEVEAVDPPAPSGEDAVADSLVSNWASTTPSLPQWHAIKAMEEPLQALSPSEGPTEDFVDVNPSLAAQSSATACEV
ncbi:hypothetical protein HDV05_003857 [Chytridiales sp. JEL 0842]|nr:hypothetical protein HDV05_003857 [Chytridiales sp. JEL 0842]